MSNMETAGRLESQPNMNFNAYVKLTLLTKEDIEQKTGKNYKKENTSQLLNEWDTPSGSIIKQEYIEETNIEVYETTIEHTTWQSSVQDFGVNVKIEATDEVEVKTEQENTVTTITETTAYSNYMENAKRNEFICQICYDYFDNYEEYVVHKNLAHKSKPFVCKVCNAQFVLSAHLNLHVSEHIDYLCMLNSSINPSEIQSSSKSNLAIMPSRNCKKSKSTSELAKKKRNTNTSVIVQQNVTNNFTQNLCVTNPNISLQKTKCKSFKCLNCVFATWSETKFLNHHNICKSISKSSSKFYQCHLCIKSFKTHSALNGHLKYHSYRREIIPRRQLALNKKKMKNNNKNSVVKSQKHAFPKIANFNRSLKCKDCNKQFTTRSKLNIHYKQHKQQMICNICHKKFVLKKNFEKHLLSHTNVISNNTSFDKSNSLQNQRAIMGSTKHKSVSETKKINSTDDKIVTQNISVNDKLFQCSLCNNFYKSKQSLSQHNRQHHSGVKIPLRKPKSKTVECDWCSIVITKCNLLRHIKSLHPNINPIKCLCCPVAFKDSLSLKLHISRCHTI